MATSSKLVVARKGRVLLVRRRRDKRWIFRAAAGGPARARENASIARSWRSCPSSRLGELRLWKEVNGKNRRSGRRMSDAIFLSKKASGPLKIGDKKELDRAEWRKPRGLKLTPTSRYIRDKLFPK